jgi:hypothetical protein
MAIAYKVDGQVSDANEIVIDESDADLEQYIENFVGVKARGRTCCPSPQLLMSHRSSTLAPGPDREAMIQRA